MFVTLDEIKKQLNIDDDFKDDDNYLETLIDVAEKVVEKHIDMKLDILVGRCGGTLPSPLLHAVKLLVGQFYNTREAVTYYSAVELPLGFTYLISLYQNYDIVDNLYL